MVRCAVIGSRGYLGRELVRILLGHPAVETIVPVSSEAGKPYGDLVPGFRHVKGLTTVKADAKTVADADVHFLATDGEEAKGFVAAHASSKLIIDLSRAHRHQGVAKQGGWVYGQPEWLPVKKGAARVANPGCYPTASLLAAAPALKAGLAADGVLIADGKSGVSGAGATPRSDLHYPEANESTRPYKVLGHDHLSEIREAAAAVEQARSVRAVRFTPHLVPMNRGLLSTVYLPSNADATADKIKAAYEKAYANSPFVRVTVEADTAPVRGSNFADVAVDLDAESGLIVARCAIDNLVKGGSGQAVENMNMALGFQRTLGLMRPGGGP